MHPDVYKDELDALDDLNCTQAAPVDAIRVACVGDSITAGATASDSQHSYPGQLQTMLDTIHGPGRFSVSNLGATATTMQVDTDMPYWKTPNFKALSDGNWDVIVIMLGTNDAKQIMPGCIPGPCMDTCPLASDYTAFLKFCTKLGRQPALPPEIFIMIPPPIMRDMCSGGIHQHMVNSVYPKLVPQIQSANPEVTGVIDLYSKFGGTAEWRKQFPIGGCSAQSSFGFCALYCDMQSCDQCHPNDQGYSVVARDVQKVISAMM